MCAHHWLTQACGCTAGPDQFGVMLLSRAAVHLCVAGCLPFTWEAVGMEAQAPGLCARLTLQSGPRLCALPTARKCSSSPIRGCHWLPSNFLCFSCLRACLQNAGCLQGRTEQGELEGLSAEGARACVRPLTCRVLFQMYRLTLRTSKETVSQRLCELLSEQF